MKRITAGDIVRLKSGSPDMTVETIFESSARVSWFTRDETGNWSEPHTDAYRIDALELVEEDEL